MAVQFNDKILNALGPLLLSPSNNFASTFVCFPSLEQNSFNSSNKVIITPYFVSRNTKAENLHVVPLETRRVALVPLLSFQSSAFR